MKPSRFVDVETTASIGSLPVMGRLFSALHGQLRQDPGRFVLALPRLRTGQDRHPGNVVRIFAETSDCLAGVVSQLANNERLQGYVRYGLARTVPENFDGPWIEYRRYRIPGNRSRLEKCRNYRLEQAEAFPFIRATSKSNRQAFSLHICTIPGKRSEWCAPDSYGLSLPTRPFALPDIR
jgi:hypothetical protein